MTGTILISKEKSFDVRTIDFLHIVERLRIFVPSSESKRKIFQAVDEFGMNMICVDEFDAAELKDFENRLERVKFSVINEDENLAGFIETVCDSIRIDPRIARD